MIRLRTLSVSIFMLAFSACIPLSDSDFTPPIELALSPQVETVRPQPTTVYSLATIPSDLFQLTFESLGIPASYQNIENHWSLWDLQLWHNRIYLAHGDWMANTGPVRIIYFDLESEQFMHDEGFIAHEEAIERFRVYDDQLYAPGADSRGGWEYGAIYAKRWETPWQKHASIPGAIHIWDIADLDGMLIATGRIAAQNSSFGALWLSRDGGQSWEAGPDFQAEGYAEATSLFVLHDRAYATTIGTGCIVFDGIAWEPADCIASSLFEGVSHVHKNALFKWIIAMAPYAQISDPKLHLFDGQHRWTIDLGQPVRAVVSTDTAIYVLTGLPSGAGSIFRASTLACRCPTDFVRIVDFSFGEAQKRQETDSPESLGSTPLSLEFADQHIYIGLSDGRFLRSSPFFQDE